MTTKWNKTGGAPEKTALVLFNPIAGRGHARESAQTLARQLTREGWRVEMRATARKGDARALACREARAYSLLVCCGGDGTLHEVTGGVLDAGADVPVGYVPAGTTNDMAGSLGLVPDGRDAARAVLGARPVARDAGRFAGQDFFCYVACFGAFADVSYRTPQRLKNRLGKLAYFVCAFLGLPGLHPYELEFSLDGGAPQRGRFLFGSVSNAPAISGIFRFRRGDVRLDDGRFELMLLRAPENPVQFFKMAHELIHRESDERFVIFRHVRRVSFRFAKPISWTLDGEFAGLRAQAGIEVLPGALCLLGRAEAGGRA